MTAASSGQAPEPKRILILGGGFGGIRAALDLAAHDLPNVRIILISDKHHFGYTPALYKLATGRSPMETCIPLGEIFEGRKKGRVEFVVDAITSGSLADKTIIGESGSRYQYDYLILALGAETSYFNIPGIAENSFTLKSVGTALRLKNHLHYLFNNHSGLSKGELMSHFQFVVVGGGPAGVELAGEIRRYARMLARMHGVSQKLVTVTILQATPRLLGMMPEKVSELAMQKLDKLGVNIILNRAVTSEDAQGVYLKDIKFNSKTIIWTAGVHPSHIYSSILGLALDKSGKILVDEHLRVLNAGGAFAIGDSASTPFAGTAQTAIYDGSYAAHAIARMIKGQALPAYKPKKVPYVVPIGRDWAIFTYKNIALSGRLFWWLRQIIDFRYFLSILPFGKAFTVWREGGVLCESCPTCRLAEEENRA